MASEPPPTPPLRDDKGKYTSPKKINRSKKKSPERGTDETFIKRAKESNSDTIYDADTDNDEVEAAFQPNQLREIESLRKEIESLRKEVKVQADRLEAPEANPNPNDD